jgi:hypothetical protein
MHRTNGDLRYNLLEAAHKRRTQLRYDWTDDLIDIDEWFDRKQRLERWVNYRLAKLTRQA